MQVLSTLVLAAGLVIVGIPPASEFHTGGDAAASARFTNNTTGTATVRANGAAFFTDVATGQTTQWADINDSTVTFVMVTSLSESDSAWVSQKIEEGARYALVGSTGADGKPVLTVAVSEAAPSGTSP